MVIALEVEQRCETLAAIHSLFSYCSCPHTFERTFQISPLRYCAHSVIGAGCGRIASGKIWKNIAYNLKPVPRDARLITIYIQRASNDRRNCLSVSVNRVFHNSRFNLERKTKYEGKFRDRWECAACKIEQN